MLLDAEGKLPRAPRPTLRTPVPLCPPQTGVTGTAQSASPVGSQLPGLEHRDHPAPLRARFLLQADHDDVPSSPGRETREMSHVLRCYMTFCRDGGTAMPPRDILHSL